MKRLLVIMVITLLLPRIGFSQVGNRNTESVSIGVKGGLAMPGMAYSEKHLSELTQELYMAPMCGLYVDVPLGGIVSIAPEVMFAQRGVSMNYQHYSGADVNYSIHSKYADLRVPVLARLKLADAFQPYVFGGAEAGYLLGGQIHIDRSAPVAMDETIDIGKANMAAIHVGAYAGLGVRSDIDCGFVTLSVRLEASYHRGFVDSYSEMEHAETAMPININAYNVSGKRMPKGLELCLGIGLPLRFDNSDDACSTFTNRYRPKHRKGVMYGF